MIKLFKKLDYDWKCLLLTYFLIVSVFGLGLIFGHTNFKNNCVEGKTFTVKNITYSCEIESISLYGRGIN